MNKHAEYYENLDLFGCFGDQGSLEVAIGDHGSLKVSHIFSFVSFYYLIASLFHDINKRTEPTAGTETHTSYVFLISLPFQSRTTYYIISFNYPSNIYCGFLSHMFSNIKCSLFSFSPDVIIYDPIYLTPNPKREENLNKKFYK
jgi:hypothetical protein